MSNKCTEHNIERTDSGDCPICSQTPFVPKPGVSDAGNDDSSESKNSKTVDESTAGPEIKVMDNPVKNTLNFEESKAKNMSAAQAGYMETVYQINNHWGNAKSDDAQFRIISLFESSEITKFKDYAEPNDSPLEVIENFKRERILLLGDPGNQTSHQISGQIARSIEIKHKEENIRFLSLSKYKSDLLTVENFSLERKVSDGKIFNDALIIINALKAGDDFADSLLNNDGSLIEHYPSLLEKYKLYIICLIKADSITNWLDNGITKVFPYWIVPDKKSETLSAKDISDTRQNVEKLLNSEVQTEAQIIKTILFIVSFFPNLTTGDFNELIGTFLRIEPEVIIEEKGENGSEHKSLTKTSPWEIWKSKSSSFTERCFLKQTKDEQNRRVVNFQNALYTEHIKEQLENNYWAFVDEKVSQILEMRLIFHLSDGIADQSAAILAEYLPGNEEKFIDWLLWVFNVLNDGETRAEGLRKILGIPDPDNLSGTEETGRQYFYYNRLGKWFRKILRNSSLKETVSSIMERLIQDRCFRSALMLVKKLQNAANFDESYWLKQLLERGDEKTGRDVETYLFNNLVNKNINEVLNRLKDWLSKAEIASEKYSRSQQTALLLLVKYYSYQINIFDEKLYGAEPSQFSMFNFEDRESAEEYLDQLIKCLLHPANIRLQIEEMPYIFYAAFVIERWSQILCKNIFSADRFENSPKAFGNQEILNLLLEKVITNADEEEQEIIKSFWKYLQNLHDTVYRSDADWEIRERAAEEREFLISLIELFNDKQWELK